MTSSLMDRFPDTARWNRGPLAVGLVVLVGPALASAQQAPQKPGADERVAGAVSAHTLPVLADRPPLLLVQVVDAETGRPIPGVQVFLAGTAVGGVTDAAGRFDLYAPETGPRRVSLRQIGRTEASIEVPLERSTVTQVLAALGAVPIAPEGAFLLPPLPGAARSATVDTTAAR